MRSNKKIPEQHATMAHDKDFWSLPKKEAIALLMRKHDISRERAEAILQRDPSDVRRHVMERVSREEFEESLKELARSDGEVFKLGSSARMDEPDDEE